jgi:tRNA-specific 2-thiouridylase
MRNGGSAVPYGVRLVVRQTVCYNIKYMSQKVYVGMSGGVDSSVTAALLKEQGYDVTGVYMKNWSQDLPGFACPWKQDYQDAKRVAVQLGIPFRMYDFEKEYHQKVVDYMIAEYRAGRTPNPDVMCNQEIKFKIFLDAALADGADLIATGHYAKVQDGQLLEAANVDKDQTYFLYRVTENALRHSLMPIGEFVTKAEVRARATELGLATAEKKDSQGICFVGKVGIKEFLLHELGEQPYGKVIDQHGNVVGEHDGAIFYTIGQRHGLHVGGGLPFYVVGKDMEKNEVYVTTDLQDDKLWRSDLRIADLHWINEAPESGKDYQVRTRYRAELVACHVELDADGMRATIVLDEEVRAITPGQSAVLYDGYRVVGGGIVL